MAKLLIVQREQFTSATSRASAKQNNNNGVANTAIETLTVLSFTLERSRGTVSVFWAYYDTHAGLHRTRPSGHNVHELTTRLLNQINANM